jgi:hypothetical protein
MIVVVGLVALPLGLLMFVLAGVMIVLHPWLLGVVAAVAWLVHTAARRSLPH